MIIRGDWNIDGKGGEPIPERFKKFAQEKFREMWTDAVKIGLGTIAASLLLAQYDGILTTGLVLQIILDMAIVSVLGVLGGYFAPKKKRAD
mmetsp:Transcript_12047/g.13857  ORF Transcript_12047/g.13857 Transcript_12047/m.13857 type:complete len:91 (+) Transcript_12047:351-623(+)|eukprot:CAMPEP_0184038928 /NCGR_PEP_ID=MMETSP0955-20130417/49779_1 /TAXON_ID=627963 /ORGANISM="Aplanochytrium sp, Strain PBS07" /LENGTH=90 /DNA_ID=CAMNT_0026327803 /DNA_START=326 /DNA_END=598 /DNA_ORIENTATION=-